MKKKFWLCKRGSVYYLFDSETGHRTSLRTEDQTQAEQILQAKNQVEGKPLLGLALAKAYLSALDPHLPQRTWQDVLDEFCSRGQPQTQAFRKRKARNKAFNLIRHKKLVETTSDDFRAVLGSSGVMVHCCLRCAHNLAVGLGWLPWPVLPPKLWPKLRFKPKRGITWQEHQRILAAEKNSERRSYYDLLWEIGASQTDAVSLTAEEISWQEGTLTYQRKKTGTSATLVVGPRLEAILRSLPPSGPLFPHMSTTTAGARSAEFWRRCRLLGIKGISLHSYRYAWAERAKACGYPERFAQEALGHNSKAVHRAYARHAKVVLPSLAAYERQAREQKIVLFPEGQDGQQPPAKRLGG